MSSAWISRTLGDCFTVTNEKGKQLKSTEYQTSGLLPVVDQSEQFICGFTDEVEKQYGGPLPITVFGDHSRHVKYVNFRFAAGADGTQLLRPSQGLDDRFFYYTVARASTLIGNYGYDRHLKHLRRFEADFPASVAEQRKIARILFSVDDLIERTEALIAKYRAIKQGLMHDLLTRGVDASGRLRPPREEAPGLYRESAVGWVPREWEVRFLEECVQARITYGIVQAGPHIEGGIPYIRTGDMSGDQLKRDGLLCTSHTIADSFQRSEVRASEIVCAIRATVGKVLEVPPDLDGANLTQGTARIAPLSAVNAHFLLWALRSNSVQRQFASATKGTTFAEITLGALRKIMIPLPCRRTEQDLVAQVLDRHNSLTQAEQTTLHKLKLEKAGLMQDLLTGRVRVGAADAFGNG
jgi:type I restriction enzyme, S subunit